jgi:hypothetical protein
VLSSLKIFPIQLEDNNLIALAKMPSTPLSENLPKIKLWEFFYSEWRGLRLNSAFGATGAGKNQKSLPRVECTILLPCNAGYEIVQVSVVGT